MGGNIFNKTRNDLNIYYIEYLINIKRQMNTELRLERENVSDIQQLDQMAESGRKPQMG